MFKYLISCYILYVCILEIFVALKFGMEFVGGLILVHNFWGVLFEALGIFFFLRGGRFLPPLDRSCHLRSGVPPPLPDPRVRIDLD